MTLSNLEWPFHALRVLSAAAELLVFIAQCLTDDSSNIQSHDEGRQYTSNFHWRVTFVPSANWSNYCVAGRQCSLCRKTWRRQATLKLATTVSHLEDNAYNNMIQNLLLSSVQYVDCTKYCKTTYSFTQLYRYCKQNILTLIIPLKDRAVTLCHPGLTYIFHFLTFRHSGAQGWAPECPNVGNLKSWLDLDGTEHSYKCNHLMPPHFKGL